MDAFVYVASSCNLKRGVGGWAAVLVDSNSNIKQLFGYAFNTTHNYLLLLAVLNALQHAKANNLKSIIIFTDSEYLYKVLRYRRYRRANKNYGLIKEIFKQARDLKLRVEFWTDDPFLVQAKQLARKGMYLAYKTIKNSKEV